MDFMSGAALAKGAGSLISSISGAFGRKGLDLSEYARGRKWQLREDIKQAGTMPAAMKEGWENAGIHPIYGMGGSSAQFSSSQPIGAGDSAGDTMREVGSGIQRAAEAYTDDRERLQNRLLETQIEGQEIENTAKAANIRLATTAGTPGMPETATVQRNTEVPVSRQATLDADGRVRIRPVVGEAEPGELEQAIDYITITAPQDLRNAVARSVDNIKNLASGKKRLKHKYTWRGMLGYKDNRK